MDLNLSIHSEDGDVEGPSSYESAPLPVGSTPLEDALLKKLDDDKAQDIVLIDLRGKSPMSDAMIVASGRSRSTRTTRPSRRSRRTRSLSPATDWSSPSDPP